MREALQRFVFRAEPGAWARGAAAVVARVAATRAPRARPVPPGPVLLVGGPAVGGAGRTAVVGFLAGHFAAQGLRVAVLGHGYGGAGRGLRAVGADAWRDGDEAVALRASLPATVAVWVGPRRSGVRRLASTVDLLLVDGGLLDAQTPASAALMVLDATAGTGVFPAGPLRCALATALSVADHLWLHRIDEPGAASPAPAALEPFAGRLFTSAVVPVALRDAGGDRVAPTWLAGRAVGALSGIARPGSFAHTLRAAGAAVVRVRARADHAWFTAADLAGLPPGATWITTTKDAPRLPPGWDGRVLETSLRVTGALATLIPGSRPMADS